jgi:hypothetical protein
MQYILGQSLQTLEGAEDKLKATASHFLEDSMTLLTFLPSCTKFVFSGLWSFLFSLINSPFILLRLKSSVTPSKTLSMTMFSEVLSLNSELCTYRGRALPVEPCMHPVSMTTFEEQIFTEEVCLLIICQCHVSMS